MDANTLTELHTGDLPEAAIANDPVHAERLQRAVVRADEELVFPNHKRVFAQYTRTESGATELHLHYNDKAIEFDEPELFAFGETLTKQSRFVAGSATGWGAGYDWPRVQELLATLIDEGVLARAADAVTKDVGAEGIPHGIVPTTLPRGPCKVARSWFEFENISREFLGRAIEVGYLECIVPIHRVAHMCLDAEGRQVGEANVYPAQLRLDLPTEWRTCPQPGSRYLNANPMNVTALKSMRQHWRPMMAALATIRETYLERYPEARNACTVGHLLRMSTLVLALPAYLLMRREERVENGALHPVLSSMFRVTDGVHMTMSLMLYTALDGGPLLPAAPMASAAIRGYAERNDLLRSNHGVCAGPNLMIDEFLSVFVDGTSPASDGVIFDDAMQSSLAGLPGAFDYCLYGLQTHAVLFSLWPLMGQAYERLSTLVEAWRSDACPPLTNLRLRLHSSLTTLRTSSGAIDEWQRAREQVYADMYAHCVRGLGTRSANESLAACLAPADAPHHAPAAERLRVALNERLHPRDATEAARINDLVVALLAYCKQEQAVVRSICQSQRCINQLLQRTPAERSLLGSDLQGFYRMQSRRGWQPYLLEDVAETLGLRIEVAADRIDIHDQPFVAA